MPVDGDVILKAGLDTSGIKNTLKGLQKTVSKGLKNAIRIGFGVRSVYALIRKLRTALFEGFGNLAQVHEPFNQAMSDIMSSLNLLKNTFASAFAPIIETVAPILVNFINLIADAVSAVGQFIAALTGKQYIAAGRVQMDYAQSVDKSASSTKNSTKATKAQTKAQKELNREITHFDDLVILHNKLNDDANDTPDVATTPSYSFSPMPVNDSIASFAKDFLAALADWDFTEIGEAISKKLTAALNRIQWDKIYRGARNFGKGLATFLNGLIKPELFTALGNTVAGALNTALHFLDSFGDNFKWDNFGESLGTGLSAFFKSWDADLTASVFTKFVNGLATTLKSALDVFPAEDVGDKISSAIRKALNGIKWKEKVFPAVSTFGTKLAQFLNGLFTTDTFSAVGKTVANLLNSALHILDNFGTTFKWKKFGNSLRSGLVTFFYTWDANLTARTFSTFVNGVFSAMLAAVTDFPAEDIGSKISNSIYKALAEIKWKEVVFPAVSKFGTKLAEFLNGLLDEDTFAEVGETVADLLNVAIHFIDSFGEKFDFNKFGNSLAQGINGFLRNFNVSRLTYGINKFVAGFRDAIIAFISTVNWYKLGTTLRDVITGINWKLVLSSIGSVIWTAINYAVDLFKGLFETDTISSPVADAVESLQTTLTEIGENIDFTAIAENIERIVTALKPAGSGFAAGFIKVFDTFFKLGGEFLNLLGPALDAVATATENFDAPVITAVGIGLGVLAGSLALFKGLSTVGTIIAGMVKPFGDFIAVLIAHPLIGIAAGVVALGAGLSYLISEGFFADDDTKAAIENCQKVIDKTSEVREGIQAVLDTAEGKDRDIDATYAVIRGMADEYFKLKTKVRLTGVEQAKLNQLEETLKEQLPGFSEIVGDTTSSYSDQKTAVFNLIKETERYYKTLAAQEFLQDYYKQMFDLEVAIQQNRDAHEELVDAADIWQKTGILGVDQLIGLRNAFEGSTGAIQDNDEEYAKLLKTQEELQKQGEAYETILESMGLSMDSVGTSASDLSTDLTKPASGLETLGEKAETASDTTSGVGDALNAFDGLSIATPLKLALIYAAIGSLSSQGKITKENTKKLYDTLDKYDASKPKQSMEKVKTAFKNAGVSTSDFSSAMQEALKEADKTTADKVKSILTETDKLPPQMKTDGKTAGKNLTDGLSGSIETGTSDVTTATENLADDGVIAPVKDKLKMNSPSKVMEEFGENVIAGLVNGIEDGTPDVTTATENLADDGIITPIKDKLGISSPSKVMEEIGKDVIQGLIDGCESLIEATKSIFTDLVDGITTIFTNSTDDFENAGSSIIDSIKTGCSNTTVIDSLNEQIYDIVDGMYDTAAAYDFTDIGSDIGDDIDSGLDGKYSTLTTLAWSTLNGMYTEANKRSFYSIGTYIGNGIYNGLIAQSSSLNRLAWNTAVDMYESACNALGISSPSKKFAWIGKMVTEGLGNGIIKNQDNAVDAVTALTDAVTNEAETANPAISISSSVDNWINALDTVLTRFSDTVIDRFDNLIGTMYQLSSFTAPPIAQGKVVPLAAKVSGGQTESITGIKEALESMSNDQVTIDDMRTLLIDLFQNYMNISFSIGDEQIAQHANAGNRSLQYRYL